MKRPRPSQEELAAFSASVASVGVALSMMALTVVPYVWAVGYVWWTVSSCHVETFGVATSRCESNGSVVVCEYSMGSSFDCNNERKP